MSNYGDLIGQTYGAQNPALPQTVGSIDEDPDKAQRAIDLSKATGVPPTSIYGDLDEFERQHKAVLASDIVANNPHLSDFVQSDPMVPKLFNRSYGQLDELSSNVSKMNLPPRGGWLGSNTIQQGLERGFGDAPIGTQFLEPSSDHPVLTAIAAAALTPVELAVRAFNAGVFGAAYGVAGPEKGEAAAQVAMDPALQATLAGLGPPGVMAEGGLALWSKLMPKVARAVPYIQSGKDPLPTISPDYDKFRADQNKDDIDALKEATRSAEALPERDANPELVRSFIAQHTPAEMGIGGDAVAAAYGDKVPTPDDNLLGWVPGIEDKLAIARATGDDVSVPIADWLAHAGADTLDVFKDDIRVRPNGITANEVKLAADQEAATKEAIEAAKPVEGEGAEAAPTAEPGPIPEDVPSLRAATALEPMLSVGDRKLTLARLLAPEKTGQQLATEHGLSWNDMSVFDQQRYNDEVTQGRGSKFGPEHGFHDFDLLDENSRRVGSLNLSEQAGGKDLYVEMINGSGGLGPRDFGPALMRDLKRQLKTEFPNAEYLVGHRVSGMRDKFQTYAAPSAMVRVRLDALDPKSVEDFGRVLEGGKWETYSPNIQAYIKPYAERSAEDRQLVDIVNNELDRIVPKKTAIQAVDTIKPKSGNFAGQRPGDDVRVGGAYISYKDTYPIILYALDSDNALGTARHEAIHHLRQYGFIKPEEWDTLTNEALAGGWLSKYKIDANYPTASPNLKLEEAVAEAYKDWAGRQDKLGERAADFAQADSPLDAIFRKMKAFFDAIRERIGALLGKDPTWEDIFQKVSTGEVGGREGTEPLDARAFNEKLSVTEPPEGGSRVFERAAALGMTKDEFKYYDEESQKQYAADIAAETKRIEDRQRREQTKEWRAQRKDIRAEVAENIRQRPDVAADLFFATGELYGKKLASGYKLDTDALTPEQQAAIPRDYQARGGLNPDDVANVFGYGSGDAMLQHLAEYNAAKKAAGMGAKDFVARVTNMEADRQMQLRHGNLEDNIVDSVKEQVAASEAKLSLLHAETQKLMKDAGITGTLNKESILAAVKDQFSKLQGGSFSSDRYLATVGRAGRATEHALRTGDAAEGFRQKQRQYFAYALAKEAVQFEKEQAKAEKLWRKYAKAFDPKTGAVDAKYSLFNRNILSRIGRPYGMSVQGMAEAIGRSGYSGLEDFVNKQNAQYGISGIQLPVADFLQDPNFRKPFADMTVAEARATMDSVKTLDKFGRNVEKVNVSGERADRRELINTMNKQVEDKFAPISHGASKQPGILRHALAASTKPETFFGRFDGRDPYGIFTKTFVLPAAKASNNEAALAREFSKAYGDAGKITDSKRLVDAPFYELDKDGKRTNQKVTGFNRENLAAVIANMGNDYNWRVFAKGWDLDPQVLWKWVESVSKPEDFDRAQAVGKLFNKGKALSDNVYDNIYGVAPENIQVRPFTMHGKQYDGWYHPIIYDPIRSNLSKLQSADPTIGGKYQDFWPSTSNAYTKRRTGAVDVISLSNDMVPIKLNQMIHDIAYREFIHETAKITRDDAFRSTITNRYGPEYVDQIDHWINSVAGAASYNSQALGAATRLSNKARQNVISTYIAFSPTTIEKHGLTALKFSMQEVGHARFAKVFAEVAADSFHRAVMDLFGKSAGLGDTLWQFAVRSSEELQRRDRNYLETFTGQQDLITGKSSIRSWIMEKGSKGVAFSDMLSAVPTWLARYREALEENGGDVGAATEQGDRAVRRAHGSTAITNRSMIESGKGPLAPWMTSIYGFFGTDLQRQIEIAHDVNDAWKLGQQSELKQAFGKVPDISSRIFTYVIWTGIVEEAVVSQFTQDHRSLLSKALSTTLGPLANTWVMLRDLAYGIQHGTDPDVGLMASPVHDAARLIRDAKKHSPLAKQNAGKLVEDAITVIGDATGKGPKHVGAVVRYGMDVWNNQQRPKTAGDVYRGVVTGSQKLRQER